MIERALTPALLLLAACIFSALIGAIVAELTHDRRPAPTDCLYAEVYTGPASLKPCPEGWVPWDER